MDLQLTLLKEAASIVSDKVFLFDQNGHILFINNAAELDFKCQLDDIKGQLIFDFIKKTICPDYIQLKSVELIEKFVERLGVEETYRDVNNINWHVKEVSIRRLQVDGQILYWLVLKQIIITDDIVSHLINSTTLLECVANALYKFVSNEKKLNLCNAAEQVLRDVMSVLKCSGGIVANILDNDIITPIAVSHKEWKKEVELLNTDHRSNNFLFREITPHIVEVLKKQKFLLKSGIEVNNEAGHYSLIGMPLLRNKKLLGVFILLSDQREFVQDNIFSLLPVLEILMVMIVAEHQEQRSLKYKAKLGRSMEELTSRNKLLEKAKKKAMQASIAKSSFLANMSHEIRTPLNAVTGLSDLLMTTSLNDKQKKYVSTILQSAEILLNLINDVLDISKIEAGELCVECIDLDLTEVVKHAVALIYGKAIEKKLKLIVSVQPDIPNFLQCDPVRLKQVIINFLSNAVKFTAKGTVHLNIELKEKSVDFADIRFSVSDTGIGIPKSAHKKVFKKFSQADSSTTRNYGGTGLGLAICQQIVRKMGGEIHLESVEGNGATFSFDLRLPLSKCDTSESENILVDVPVIYIKGAEEDYKLIKSCFHIWGMTVDEYRSLSKVVTKKKEMENFDECIIVDSSIDRDQNFENHFRSIKNSLYIKITDKLDFGDIEQEGSLVILSRPLYPKDLRALFINNFMCRRLKV